MSDPILPDEPGTKKGADERTAERVSLVRSLLLALSFLTRLPLPAFEPKKVDFPHAAALFPLAGMLIGGLGAAVFFAAELLWSPGIAVALAIIALLWMTGVLHEDGLADCADGLWGGSEPGRRLEIMRDSRIGSYGAAALASLMLLRWVLLMNLAESGAAAIALVCAHGVARTAACALLARGPYVGGGKGAAFVEGLKVEELRVIACIPVVFAMIVLGWRGVVGLCFAAAITLLCERIFRRSLGGVNGDCLGAVACCAEVAFYLGASLK